MAKSNIQTEKKTPFFDEIPKPFFEETLKSPVSSTPITPNPVQSDTAPLPGLEGIGPGAQPQKITPDESAFSAGPAAITPTQFPGEAPIETPVPTKPTTPKEQPIVPQVGEKMVFGDQAEQLNQQNPQYLAQRNQKIAVNSLQGADARTLTDNELRGKIHGELEKQGADFNDPRIANTVNDIVNQVRTQSPSYKSDDLFRMLIANQPLPINKGPAVLDAYNRYKQFQQFKNYDAQQLADILSNGKITYGSKTWNDLYNNGFNLQLDQANSINKLRNSQNVTGYMIDSMNVEKGKSLTSQEAIEIKQPNFESNLAQTIFQTMTGNSITEYRNTLSQNPDITQARDNARDTKGRIDKLNLTMKNLSDDIRAQLIGGGGVPTEGYLQALISEKSKPIIRELEALQSQYSSEVSVLSDLTDNAKLEFQITQQDKQAKLQGLQFLYGIQQDKMKAAADAERFEFEKQKFEESQAFEEEKFYKGQEFDMKKLNTQQKFELQKLGVQNQNELDKLKYQYRNDPSKLTELQNLGVDISQYTGDTVMTGPNTASQYDLGNGFVLKKGQSTEGVMQNQGTISLIGDSSGVSTSKGMGGMGGIDIAMKLNDPVRSEKDGVILKAGKDNDGNNFVEVLNDDGSILRYNHLNELRQKGESGLNLKEGAPVTAGDQIGFAGKSGRATGVHVDITAYESTPEGKRGKMIQTLKGQMDSIFGTGGEQEKGGQTLEQQISRIPKAKQTKALSIIEDFDQKVNKQFEPVQQAKTYIDSYDINTKNPSDDQSLIYAFAKMMDPDSVVREGEYATVQKYNQTWLSSFGFNAARTVDNAQILTKTARENIIKTMNSRYTSRVKNYESDLSQYSQRLNNFSGISDVNAFRNLTEANESNQEGQEFTEGQTASDGQGNKIIYKGGQRVSY